MDHLLYFIIRLLEVKQVHSSHLSYLYTYSTIISETSSVARHNYCSISIWAKIYSKKKVCLMSAVGVVVLCFCSFIPACCFPLSPALQLPLLYHSHPKDSPHTIQISLKGLPNWLCMFTANHTVWKNLELHLCHTMISHSQPVWMCGELKS